MVFHGPEGKHRYTFRSRGQSRFISWAPSLSAGEEGSSMLGCFLEDSSRLIISWRLGLCRRTSLDFSRDIKRQHGYHLRTCNPAVNGVNRARFGSPKLAAGGSPRCAWSHGGDPKSPGLATEPWGQEVGRVWF